MLEHRTKRMAAALLVAAATGLAGCGGSQGSGEQPAVAGAPQGAALREPMTEAVSALGDLTARLAKGDTEGARAAHEAFARSFGEVLGPLSFQDVSLAQRVANANSAIVDQLAGKLPDRDAVAKQAAVIVDGLQQAATAMGVSLTARAGAELGAAAQGDQQVLQVTAREYFFTPNRLEVKAGSRVTVRFTNAGTENHEWELEDFDVEVKPIPPGSTGEVTFVANKKGAFEFACHVDGHYEKGMKGTLVVK